MRTLPGTHPEKGSFFTRGTSRDEYAKYTEDGAVYVCNMDRLLKKWQTASTLVPKAEIVEGPKPRPYGLIFYGTTAVPMAEAAAQLRKAGIEADSMRVRAFPFGDEVDAFIARHETVFIVEQNRDGQLRQLLIAELEANPAQLVPILNYDGMPITASYVADEIGGWFERASGAQQSEGGQ